MVELALSITRTETLLDSDMLGVLILSYVFLLLILFVSFLNIYSIDKYEFMHNKQKCMDFKHKMIFIVMYSKEKRVVSKKTFVLEVIGYTLALICIAAFISSLKQNIATSFIILGIIALIILVFGCLIGAMYSKIKSKK